MKLSKTTITKIMGYIAQGLTINNACQATGISRKTYYLWYTQGKQDSEKEIKSLQQTLYDAIPDAQSLCEQMYLQRIADAGKKDWRAIAWILERTNPKTYGRHTPTPIEPEEDDTLTVIN